MSYEGDKNTQTRFQKTNEEVNTGECSPPHQTFPEKKAGFEPSFRCNSFMNEFSLKARPLYKLSENRVGTLLSRHILIPWMTVSGNKMPLNTKCWHNRLVSQTHLNNSFQIRLLKLDTGRYHRRQIMMMKYDPVWPQCLLLQLHKQNQVLLYLLLHTINTQDCT